MNCETARTRLQEQIDGALDPVIGRELAAHLDTCAPCRAFGADLAAIADAAAALDPIEPPEHVWLQVAGTWRREHPESAARSAPARRPYAVWHGLAAAAVLAVAAGGGWIAWRATGSPAAPASESRPASGVLLAKADAGAGVGNADGDALVESARRDIEAAEQLYARAIAGLEKAANEQKDLLAPEVAAALDKNIEVIDEAIGESRSAVRAQPESVVARESLFEALRRKVTLLQNTISLVSEISRGNQAGASRLAGT